MKKQNFGGIRGDSNIGAMIVIFILVILLASFLPIMSSGNVESAKATLWSRGYVVLAASEYSDIMALLGSIDTKADAAVTAAQAAVVTAQTAADKVDLFNTAEVFLFPATSNLTCTLTAGDTNVWSSWAEVTDSGATTLSTSFAADPGYVSDMLFFLPSDAADGYNVELAYGASKVTLGRVGFWALADGDIAYTIPIKSRRVPAGEAIYYRMQSTGANGATVQVRLRYFFE